MFLVLFSCRKQIDFQLPTQTQSLVVNSNLCADSFISFTLKYTQAINDNTKPLLENNAIIEIFTKDTLLLETIPMGSNGHYLSVNTKAQASLFYLVKISLPGKVYWMGDSVPSPSQSKILKTDSIIFQGKENFFRINYQLKDLQNGLDYYGIKMKHYCELYTLKPNGDKDTTLIEEWIDVETIDPILTEDQNNKFSKKHLLFSDKYFNGSPIIFNFGTGALANSISKKTKSIVIYMEHYTRQAYDYYSTLNEHIFYQNDPFSQPTLVKGNINGAYGSFTGKNVHNDSLIFKY